MNPPVKNSKDFFLLNNVDRYILGQLDFSVCQICFDDEFPLVKMKVNLNLKWNFLLQI